MMTIFVLGWTLYSENKSYNFEPSYIVLGSRQYTICLNNDNPFVNYNFVFVKAIEKFENKEGIKDNKELWGYESNSRCYENLNKTSFILLDHNNLYQFNIIKKENKIDFEVIYKRDDKEGEYFLRKDDILYILNKNHIFIYHF